MTEKEIPLSIEGIKAKIIYHTYQGFEVKTLLLSLEEKHRVLSTREGYKEVSFVATCTGTARNLKNGFPIY